MPRHPRKSRTYKDSGPIKFEITQVFEVPRRELKKKFDNEKAMLLEDLALDPNVTANRIAHVRKLDFPSFVSMLQREFEGTFTLEEVKPETNSILLWAAFQFDDWASPQ